MQLLIALICQEDQDVTFVLTATLEHVEVTRSSSKHSGTTLALLENPTSGKVKDSLSAEALEANSPLHIWFLKIFLSIFENKWISLILGKCWGGALATPPGQWLKRRDYENILQRYDCQNTSQFVFWKVVG